MKIHQYKHIMMISIILSFFLVFCDKNENPPSTGDPSNLVVTVDSIDHETGNIIIRATADNREVSEAMGINMRLVYMKVFTLGTVLGTLGGVMCVRFLIRGLWAFALPTAFNATAAFIGYCVCVTYLHYLYGN